MGVGLNIGGAHSPGGTASQLLERMGVRPPLAKFRLGDDEFAAWLRAFHGGWVTSGPLDGVPFPAVDADVRSAFPVIASLLGWWDYTCAQRLRPVDVTRAFRRFLSAPDLMARMLDLATWRRWGLTRVVVRAQGEPWPVEVAESNGPRLHVVPTWAESLDATWLDAVAASVLAGRQVEVIRAIRLAPRGRQDGLSTVRIPGSRLHPDEDPAVSMVRLRRKAIAQGNNRLASLLRVLVNAMVYGNPARFDSGHHGRERPGPWCFPPLAATVPAGARCILAMVEAQVWARGGVIAARDTDGLLLVASRRGGDIQLPDGTNAHVLSWCDTDAVLDGFNALGLFRDGGPFWSIKREHRGRPIRAVVWGPKRHTLFVHSHGIEVVASTEHVLGALAAPPGTTGRRDDGRHLWTEDVARVLAGVASGECDKPIVPTFRWERNSPDFPALRRLSLSGPKALRQMPAAFGFRPFARVIEGQSAYPRHDARPVTPDPGGELVRWRELPWRDAHGGQAVGVSTDPLDLDRVILDSLRARSVAWSRPTGQVHREAVVVDPLLVRPVGRAGGAFTGGSPQAVRSTVDIGSVLMTAARLLGVPRFASLTGLPERTVRALASGRRPRGSTVRKVWLAISGHFGSDPLPGLLDLAEGDGPCRCVYPGCDVAARIRSHTCSERHRKALARLTQGVPGA
jgi:hypothetical protein